MQQHCRKIDIIGRFGGDEFVIILKSITVMDEAEEVARQILGSIAELYTVNGKDQVNKNP